MTSEYLKRLDVQGHIRVKEALRRWDPIGVYGPGSTCPDDEYDSYSVPIMSLLDSGAPKERIVEYLRSVCVEHMEIGFDRPLTERIVEELLAFWPVWKQQMKELGPHHLIDE